MGLKNPFQVKNFGRDFFPMFRLKVNPFLPLNPNDRA
jgi:hypothetical protein